MYLKFSLDTKRKNTTLALQSPRATAMHITGLLRDKSWSAKPQTISKGKLIISTNGFLVENKKKMISPYLRNKK
jgi:hypothetical protein